MSKRIARVNTVPEAELVSWREFHHVMDAILEKLAPDQDQLMRTFDAAEYEKLEEKIRLKFERGIEKYIDEEFREFARGLPAIMSVSQFHVITTHRRAEAAELRKVLKRFANTTSGFAEIKIATREYFAVNSDGTLNHVNSGDRALKLILKKKIPITRLVYCPACKKIRWRKYAGPNRTLKTCGERRCVDKVSNRNRTKKGE